MKHKFGIITFPGADFYDLKFALQDILEQNVIEIWYQDSQIPNNIESIFVPSYAPVLPISHITNSYVFQQLKHLAKNYFYLIALGNGLNLLWYLALMPGYLSQSANNNFIAKNQFVRVENRNTILTKNLDSETAYRLPIAHQGGFTADPSTITEMRKNKQIILRYCNSYGHPTVKSNPDNSAENIAGITNKNKNIFGIIPRIDLAVDDELGNTDGILFFNNLLNSL